MNVTAIIGSIFGSPGPAGSTGRESVGKLCTGPRPPDRTAQVHRRRPWSRTLPALASLITATAFLGVATSVPANTYPPVWGSGTVNEAAGPIHFAPVAWPSEPANPADCAFNCGDWKPYTRFQSNIADPRVQDPSNGGTAPQNYVNISSSCIDKSYPSVYYNLRQGAASDGSQDVIMFRWRVEQIAHNYANGNTPGSFGATDPWSSGQWSVLFDLNGDGYRDVAAYLNGSSGDPSHAVDVIQGIYGNLPSQSVDSTTPGSGVYAIAHNPTAFTSGSTILNFQSSLTPVTAWPAGSTATRWDYGTTRAELVYTSPCNEYFVDYQIPVRMLDASATGPNSSLTGPKIDRATPISMLFCTANSLNNPFQKDCALNKAWVADASQPAPFGDYISFNSQTFDSPTVDAISATGCGTNTLSAKVKDTIAIVNNAATATVGAVGFYYYYDANANGSADDDSTWTFAATGALQSGTLNTWNATWNSSTLLNGQYLIGVQAVDSNNANLFDIGATPPTYVNRTYSYLTPTQVTALGTPPANEKWYANPTYNGVITAATKVNSCDVPTPFVTKSASPSATTTSGEVTFTVTPNNTTGSPITLSQIADTLPAGFSYMAGSTTGDCGTAEPAVSGSTLTWSCASAIPARVGSTNGTRALTFHAYAPSVTGTYSNTAQASTGYSASPLVSDPVQIGVGAPRLTIAETPSSYSAVPGNTITYSITFSNDSPVDASTVTLTDTLLTGMTFVTSSCGGAYSCTYNGTTKTLTWDLGNLPSGAGPYTVTFQATVDNPYPAAAATPYVNSSTIDGTNTDPASASASVAVIAPRPLLTLAQTANKALVNPAGTAPANQVVFTIGYQNIGDASATSVVLTDPLPTGFTFVSATNPAGTDCTTTPSTCSNTAGTVTWNLGTLAANASGSVTVTAQATTPFTGSALLTTNTASIIATGTTAVTDSANVAVQEPNAAECNNYFLTNQPNVSNPLNLEARLSTAGLTSSTITQTFTTTTFVEMAKFYQEGTAAQTIIFRNANGTLATGVTLSGNAFVAKTSNTNMDFKMEVFDFDPNNPTTPPVPLASDTQTFNGNSGNKAFALTVATTTGQTTQLTQGHKLLIVISGALQKAGSASASLTVNVSPITDATAGYTQVCSLPPPNLVLEKLVNSASVAVTGTNRTLTYTLNYANSSPANAATSALLTDTLPAGVTFSSCSVGTSAFTGCSHSSGTVTFHNGSGLGVTIPANGTGSVTITVNVANDLTGNASLLNTASLTSTQTSAVTASAATAVIGGGDPSGSASIVMTKQASKTLLLPGDLVTYTLRALNAGTKSATAVTVTDAWPTTYLDYMGSATLNGISVTPTGTSPFTVNVGTLAPGAMATITFQLQVKASGIPNGVTDISNTGAASYSGCLPGPSCSSTSDPVVVTVSTNPNLSLVKTASPALPTTVAPGEDIEYTLAVSNTGSGAAATVQVSDPIPTNTVFKSITASDGFTGRFDAATNRVVFTIASLAAGAADTLKFKVTVNSPLPSGTTSLLNTASISASNATGRSSSAGSTATASPTLTLTESGPAASPFPATTLTANAAAGATTLFVASTANLTVGQYIMIGTDIRQITALAGTSLTLNAGLSTNADSGAGIIPAITYSISYQNTGTADATSVTITDTLPSGLLYVTSSPTATSAPAQGANDVAVTWNLGTVLVGASGSVQVVAIPTAAGIYYNVPTMLDSGTGYCPSVPANCTSTVTTLVGGLQPSSSTTTPTSTAGGTALYTLTIANSTGADVTNVTVTDLLASGFSYQGDGKVAGVATEPTFATDDASTKNQPIWTGRTVPPGGLTITFTAAIGADVGPATYQDGVTVTTTTPNIGVTPFDPLSTTAEDVTILASGTGIVYGYVYRDTNANGSYDSAVDAALVGVGVTIIDKNNTAYVVYTDATGYYSRVVPSGATIVDVDNSTLPDGLVLTAGADGTDPKTVTVPSGGSIRDNVGFVAASGTVGNVSGRVFNDNGAGGGTSGNGTQDGTEPGTLGVQVWLRNATTNAIVATAYTDVLGNYLFANVATGSYQVDVAPPTGYYVDTNNDPAPVTVSSGGTATTNFGLLAGGHTVSGIVFNDVNGNGVQNLPDDTGLSPAVTVQLDLGANFYMSTTTATDGTYSFSGLADGSYTIKVAAPYGYTQTLDPDGATMDSQTGPFAVSGANVTGKNFAYKPNPVTPTYALVESFTASVRGGQVLLEWDTQTELGTASFALARMNGDGSFAVLHDGLLTGQGPAGEGGHYRFLDPGALPGVPATYRLTEVEVSGVQREVGQYTVTPVAKAKAKAAAAGPQVPDPAPGTADFTPRQPTAAETGRVAARAAEQAQRAQRAQRVHAQSVTNPAGNPANRVAISVREPGLYQVTSAALATALNWPASKVSELILAGQLRLSNHGSAVAWRATANGQGLSFYGEASRSIYDPLNVYVVEQGAGSQMAATPILATGAAGNTSFRSTITFEENRFAGTVRAKDPEEDFWVWAMLNSTGNCLDLTKACRTQDFTLQVPAPAATGNATLRLQLRGHTSLPANPDHHVRVTVNGSVIGNGYWDGLTDLRLSLPVAQGLLLTGANRVRVEAVTDPGVASNYFYLDRFELDYQRLYLAAQNLLTATGSPGQQLVASGFTTPVIHVFDLTDPRLPRVVTGAVVTAAAGGYQVRLVPAGAATPYLLVTDTAIRAPSSVRPMETIGLGTNGAHYLVIAPREFDEQASLPVQRLLNLRAGQGLSGRFVPLQAIYDEYADGQKTPHAIRRFLTAALRTWQVPPAYVVLGGKGTYDPKDYLGYGTDRLPVLMALTPDAGLIAADQRFVDSTGDGVGEVPIGRLPAATAAEFKGMVDKLIANEDAGPAVAHHAILLADGPDPAAGDFTANSEATAARLLTGGFADPEVQRIYLERMSPATAHANLLTGLRAGAELLNYYGHANPLSLDHGLLTVTDATTLTHQGPVPVMLGMTCMINRFEFPQLISLGEALVLNPAGGAAAVWSSGGFSYDDKARGLNDTFLDAMLQQGAARIGDGVQTGLNGAARSGGNTVTPGIFNLLGDPASITLLP